MQKYYLILTFVILLLFLFSCNSSKQIYKDNPQEYVSSSEILLHLISIGNPETAAEEYKKIMQGKKEDALLKIFYSRLLMLSGKNKEAKENLESVITCNSQDVDALYSLSISYGMEGNQEKQKNILLKIIEIDMNHSSALANLGEICLNEKKIDDAQNYFNRSINSNPRNIIALVGLGNISMIKKNIDTSIDFFNQAIEADPENIFAYIDRARVKEKKNEIDSAISDLNKAIIINPDYYWSYIDRGKLLLKRGKTEEAINDFSSAKKINSDYFLADVYLGEIYYQNKQWDKASMCYHNVITIKPEYHYIYERYGVLSYLKEDWINASLMFKKAFNYNKKELSYPLLVTLCLKKDGKEHEAKAYIQKELQNIPSDSWYYEMANFYINPSNDFYVQQKYKNEKNRIRKKRILFYIAAQYELLEKTKKTAFAYFFDVTNIERKDLIEYDLAVCELEKLENIE